MTRHTDCRGRREKRPYWQRRELRAGKRVEGVGENMKNPGGTEHCVGAELPTPRAAAQRVGIHRQRRIS